MQIPCPNCKKVVDQHSHPVRGPSNDGNELWVCIGCPAVVCSYPVFTSDDVSIPCYMKHTSEAHPGLYGLPSRPSKGHKKNKKHHKR